MNSAEVHMGLLEKVKTHEVTDTNHLFQAILETLVDVPLDDRRSSFYFVEVAVNRDGYVMGWTTANGWAVIPGYYRINLFGLVLDFCYKEKCEPMERTYLLELLKCMEADGINL